MQRDSAVRISAVSLVFDPKTEFVLPAWRLFIAVFTSLDKVGS